MNEAVEYLESPEYMRWQQRSTYTTVLHQSSYPEANVLASYGVTAVRPMFELIEDHETAENGRCYMCQEHNANRGILRGVSAT